MRTITIGSQEFQVTKEEANYVDHIIFWIEAENPTSACTEAKAFVRRADNAVQLKRRTDIVAALNIIY